MTTRNLLTIAIMLALPFGAMAENISGAMYTAPSVADTNHPAPTTGAGAPYGRVNIDTADQDHIATTAYVKGAYNSAIAAVNKVGDITNTKQAQLTNADGDNIVADVLSTSTDVGNGDFIELGGVITTQSEEEFRSVYNWLQEEIGNNPDEMLITSGAVLQLVHGAGKVVKDAASDIAYDVASDMIGEKRVDIYTTWDSNATTQVELSTAQ